jgi:condensin complex subunit 1
MVGHIAIKQIVHLEAIESEWKRRKYLGMRWFPLARRVLLTKFSENKNKSAKKNAEDLEAVTGTAEDEFSEKVMHIREREILFGEKALFGVFAPMMAFICTNNRSFKVYNSTFCCRMK